MRSIQFSALGPPSVLQMVSGQVPRPGPKQLVVKTLFAGVNMIDTYFRTGVYKVEALPSCLGKEFCGVVEETGAECTLFRKGQLVASCSSGNAAYATHVVADETSLVPVPAGIGAAEAAASLLKGLTARYLCKETFPVNPGHVCLVYAAAGGTGQILTQLIKSLGATVIAITSTEEKAAICRKLGADHVILSTSEDIAKRVHEICPEGAHVAFDSIGKATFEASLDSLRPRGMMVTYGNASGPVPEFAPLLLAKKSLFMTRPVLYHYIPDHASLLHSTSDFFEDVLSKKVTIASPTVLPLSDAGEAHTRLEGRKTTGSLVLDCSK